MKRLLLASSTIALVFGVGAIAHAHDDDDYRGYQYNQYQPYPQNGYGNQYGQPPPPPPSAYGNPNANAPLPRMADRLLEDTAQLRDRIAREVPPEQGNAAFDSVRHLERQAQRFEQSVDNLGPQNEATQAEFGRLAQAYGRAANAMESLRGYPGVYSQFAHIRSTMDRMAPMFGGFQHYGYQYANPNPNGSYQMSGPGLNFGIGGLHFHITK